MSAPLVAGAACARPGCGHGEDLHDGICFGTACECVRFVESADALPVPVGPKPRTLDVVEDELTGVSLSLYEEELRWALASAKRGRSRLRAKVGLAERACDGLMEQLARARDRIAELETGIAWRDAERERWSGVHYLIEKAIDKGWSTLDTLDVEAELGPEPAPAPAEPVVGPACTCPPVDQPGPHQVGCPQAEVPVADAATRLIPTVGWLREDSYVSPLHQTHRIPHDLPTPPSCGLSAAELDEISRDVWFGGGAQ